MEKGYYKWDITMKDMSISVAIHNKNGKGLLRNNKMFVAATKESRNPQ